MNKLIGTIIIPLTIIVCSSNAQSIKFSRIRQEDGLVHEHVLSMHKDKRGFMWVGTYGGIERYDGYEHRIYISGMNRPTGVRNYTFHCIYEDEKGELWFGTQGGLYHYLPGIDTFYSYQHDEAVSNSISNDNVRSVIKDHQGNFWIGTYGGGLNRFVQDSDKFYHYTHNPKDPNSLSSDMINILYVDSHDNLWIGTDGGGLLEFNYKSGTFKTFIKDNTKHTTLQSNTINTIGEDKNGYLWIGTWDGGLSVLDPTHELFTTYRNIPGNANSLSNDIVRALVIDKDNIVWLATFGGGLNRFDPVTKTFTVYKNDPFDPTSISNDILWSLYEDKDGILWIGTFGAGICKYDRNRNKFPLYCKVMDQKNTLPSNNISAICVDRAGIIWIGTPGNGLCSYDKKQKSFKYYLNKQNNPISYIRSIYEDPASKLWIGTDEGVVLFDQNRRIIKYYQNDPNIPTSLATKSIESICMDRQGNMWFATWNNGLFLLKKDEIAKEDPRKARFINFRHNQDDPNSLAWNIVWKVYSDRNGNIWAGTDKTFDKFNEKDQNFSHFNYRMVSSIWEEPSGIMWLGTFGFGLFKFDPAKDTAQLFNEKNGFPSIVFLGILGDKDKNLWLSTEGGLSKFDPENLSVQNFNKKDGLQGNKFNFNAYALGPDGELLFGGNDGFNMFKPSEIHCDTSKPGIVFTDFKLFNKSVSYEKAGYGTSLIKKQLFLVDTILLTHNQNFISFEFAALCFSNQSDIIYHYKLIGFDKDWHVTHASRREATYTNLNPGTYRFVVKSTNGDLLFNDKPASMLLIIKPAWYQTWLFKISLSLIFLIILFIVYLLRVESIKKRSIFLEELVSIRTNEISQKNMLLQRQTETLNNANALLEKRQEQIEQQSNELRSMNEHLLELNATKDKFFSIIAHDLKNPFGSLLGFIELLKRNQDTWDDEKKNKTIDIIDTSSKVIFDLLENLLYWSRSQTNRIRFEPKQLSLPKIIKNNLMLLKENYSNKKIDVKTDIPSNIKIFADEDMLNTIIRNLLSNAIKYTPLKGNIEVCCETIDHELIIRIKDSGIGINDELKPKLFHIDESSSRFGTEGEKGTGLGLILCKEFVEKHGGTIDFESEVNKGTTFSVHFKTN